MLDEKKQAELDKLLDELESVLYTAIKRFADNSRHLVELTPRECKLLSLKFQESAMSFIESIELAKERKTNRSEVVADMIEDDK